jgi:predicted nucleic-acid-binding protein
MTAIDRARDNAAAMIGMVWADVGETSAEILAHNVIRGLTADRLLVTDEMQAALDALAAYDADPEAEFEDVLAAARPYLASRPR